MNFKYPFIVQSQRFARRDYQFHVRRAGKHFSQHLDARCAPAGDTPLRFELRYR